jgi:type I restriction enzyme, S subunit
LLIARKTPKLENRLSLSLSLSYEIRNNNEYKTVSLAEILEEVKERKQNNQIPIWSITNDEGFVNENEEHTERVASENTSRYKIVSPNNFAYNPARINVGSLALNESEKIGCVSPSYIVFRIKNTTINPKYLYWLLHSTIAQEQIKSFVMGGVRNSLSFENLGKISIPISLLLEKQNEVVKEWEENWKEINRQKKSVEYFQEKKKKFLNKLW